jgi:hypothetical protein
MPTRFARFPLAGMVLAIATAMPAIGEAAPFGSNLIVNGNAENDVGSNVGNAIGPVTGFTTVGSASIGPVTNVDRSELSGLLFESTDGLVPVGTRSIDLTLLLSRVDGTYNDGYADNLSLVLTAGEISVPTTVPEPGTYALLLGGFGLLGYFARRRRSSVATPLRHD